ncbi:MAG: hypothetical protein ACLKAK_10925 [Alkaliphilus sp.]
MLLYLTSNENIGIFDFLSIEKGILIKKLSGSFKLMQFILRDMRSLDHYSYFAIDLSAVGDTEGEIIEAIGAFKKMFASRIVFYIDDIMENVKLVEALIETGVYNIVSEDVVEELNEEIRAAISESGITKKEMLKKLNDATGVNDYYVPEYLFKQQNIKIAVVGAVSKVGTTTAAITLCNYLASIGASVCYVEANESGHIGMISNANKEMIVKDDFVSYKGVKYLTLSSQIEDEYDFIIYDTAEIKTKTINAIKANFDEIVLCATTKSYEIDAYKRALDLLGETKIHTLFSFVPEIMKEKLKKQYGEVFFSEYAPDLFDDRKNIDVWNKIHEKYISKNTL